jgi:hypothetical protein
MRTQQVTAVSTPAGRCRRAFVFAATLLATAALGLQSASAMTWVWIGPNGDANNPGTGNFSVPAHWDLGSVPASASDTVLEFRSGAADYDANNDLVGLTINRIDHSEGAGTSLVRITGNPLAFDGANPEIASTTSVASAGLNMRTAITTAGTLRTSNAGNTANLRLNDHNVNNSVSVGELRVVGSDSTVGPNIVTIRGTQNNIGSIVLDGGTLANPAQPFNTTAVVYFGAGGQLATGVPGHANKADMNTGGWQSLAPGTGDISARSTNVGGYWFTSRVASAAEAYTFSGTFGATGGTGAVRTRLRKQGPGTQIITGNFNQGGDSNVQMRIEDGLFWFTSTSQIATSNNRTEVAGGTLQIDGTMNGTATSGAVEVFTSGRLAGSGNIRRNVNVAVGTLAPGSSIGTLIIGTTDVLRTLDFVGGNDAVYHVEIDGSSGDSTTVHGSALLNSATLDVEVLSAPPSGHVFTILTASDGVSGEFDGKADGDVFEVDTTKFQIDYSATAVTLTVIPSVLTCEEVGLHDDPHLEHEEDTEPPVLSCPGDITEECTSPDGRKVTLDVTATDNCDANPTIICVDQDGNIVEPACHTFPKGTTTVTCHASDHHGNISDPCQFTVTIVDTTPPTILDCPQDSAVVVACGGTAKVPEVTAVDACDPNPVVSCKNQDDVTVSAGDVLTPGMTHTITCVATDASGNQSDPCSFSITVAQGVASCEYLPPLAGSSLQQMQTKGVKAGSTVPHKILVLDCDGNNVTSGIIVTLDVVLVDPSSPQGEVDLVEEFNGAGDSGSRYVLTTDGHWQYNLSTKGYESNTANDADKHYISRTTVTDEATGVVICETEVTWETRK